MCSAPAPPRPPAGGRERASGPRTWRKTRSVAAAPCATSSTAAAVAATYSSSSCPPHPWQVNAASPLAMMPRSADPPPPRRCRDAMHAAPPRACALPRVPQQDTALPRAAPPLPRRAARAAAAPPRECALLRRRVRALPAARVAALPIPRASRAPRSAATACFTCYRAACALPHGPQQRATRCPRHLTIPAAPPPRPVSDARATDFCTRWSSRGARHTTTTASGAT